MGSKRGTVVVQITREQAKDLASWLSEDYKPCNPPPLSGDEWHTQQLEIAHQLEHKLDKAARRKRTTDEFKLRLERRQAQWLGALTSTTGEGCWVFASPDQTTDVFVRAQQSPDHIRRIASLFLKAASSHKGRPKPRSKEIEQRLDELEGDVDSDERWRRRLRRKGCDLRRAQEETEVAEKMIKKTP